MTTTYFSARSKLESAVRELQKSRGQKVDYEVVPIEEAVGRVSACDHFSPISTPEFDTSAMDGYAIRSESTKVASQKSPVFFCVKGTVAAGDDSPSLPMEQECDGPEPCFEIMTGGRFPEGEVGEVFDACVKVEDTVRIATKEPGLRRCIAISKPIPRYANRRFAGEDIQKGDLVLRNGMTIRSSNIMPLASVGIDMIRVRKKPRRRQWGLPYGSIERSGTEADFFGSITDEVESLVQEIRDRLESSPMDLMITSGGVSVGKFDHVRQALELLGATIVFHGVAIRPGHPVLFALLPSAWGEVAFFGLPGNPGAAAACFKFLTIPYMKYLLGQELERPVLARLENLELGSSSRKSIMDAPNRGLSCDRFRPGVLHVTGDKGPTVYEGAGVLGPAKMAPFVQANCWIHIKANEIIETGQMVSCYPMNDSLIS